MYTNECITETADSQIQKQADDDGYQWAEGKGHEIKETQATIYIKK